MSEPYTAATPVGGGVPDGFVAVRGLGSGPRGRVVLCRRSDGTEVVVRMLSVDGLDAEATAGLESESAAAAAASGHACAVRVNRVWSDKRLGVCSEQAYCPGGSLSSAVAVDSEAVALGGARLATALAYSHSRGVLHGDVRPANVLLAADGAWLLANCGLAAAVHRARPTVPAADPAFAPREMLGWEKPAPSADVYGLGATLQFALAGATAVPAVLTALIERMLAAAPADRPPLTEVDQALRRLVAAPARNRLPAAVLLVPPSAPPRPKLPAALVAVPVAAAAANRNRMLIAAAAVGVVFLGGATAVAVSNSGGSGGKAVMTAASAPPTAATSRPASASPTATPAAPKPGAKPAKQVAAAPKPAAQKPAVAAPPPPAPVPQPPVAAPAPAAAVDPRHVTPFDVAVEPVNEIGFWQLKVTWKMDDFPPAVSGWEILVGAPSGGSVTPEDVLLKQAVSSKNDKPYFQVVYRLKRGYPLSSCVGSAARIGDN
ncbi:MAG TPA: protein kinase [Sporichthyaceae bacterium]|nr:protein kinase [Sporichthyaceae bacterium]